MAAFTDFSKAYDRVCRETLWRCWRMYGVKRKFQLKLFVLYLVANFNGGKDER